MRRVVTIPVVLATTVSYVVDRDTTLIAAYSTVSGANGCVLSTDPSLTAAMLLTAPAAGSSVSGAICLLTVSNSSSFAQNLQLPLPKGTTLYLNASVGAWAFLLFEDVVPVVQT
jgi:hypothetical protein